MAATREVAADRADAVERFGDVVVDATARTVTRGGEPGTPAWLFLVGVNGIPALVLLGAGILDATGTWALTLLPSVPPSLEGSVFECRSFSTRPVLGDQPRKKGKQLLPQATFQGGFELIDSANAVIDIPDPCSPDLGTDCNQNGVLDSCDIADGTSQDLDQDGVPDECRLDIQVPLDFLTLQEALDFAVDGGVITVSDGTYTGTGNGHLDFGGKALTLQSEHGPAGCILELAGGTGFVFQSGETPSSVVRGFTLRNGRAPRGGAVYCSTGSPTIESCIFVGNIADERGGALYSLGSSVALRNCLFIQNVALLEHGGAVVVEGGNPTLRHCTFASNFAHPFFGKGGALYLASGTLAVHHCTFWGNFAGQGLQLFAEPGASLSVDWCDVQGGWSGQGQNNLALDPLFLDAPNLDFHLSPTSPCIDAGDPAFVPLPGETDVDGEARLQGNAVDLGADEAGP